MSDGKKEIWSYISHGNDLLSRNEIFEARDAYLDGYQAASSEEEKEFMQYLLQGSQIPELDQRVKYFKRIADQYFYNKAYPQAKEMYALLLQIFGKQSSDVISSFRNAVALKLEMTENELMRAQTNRKKLPLGAWILGGVLLVITVLGILWVKRTEQKKEPLPYENTLLKGQQAYKEGRFEEAFYAFQDVLEQIPASNWAERKEIMILQDSAEQLWGGEIAAVGEEPTWNDEKEEENQGEEGDDKVRISRSKNDSVKYVKQLEIAERAYVKGDDKRALREYKKLQKIRKSSVIANRIEYIEKRLNIYNPKKEKTTDNKEVVVEKSPVKLRVQRNGVIEPEMAFVKGGVFTMGSSRGEEDENPPHTVTLSDFYMGKYEVTVAEYRTYCQSTGRQMPGPPSWGWQDAFPMVFVSWYDADAYCKWLSSKTGKNYRLPTEAEWEYVARGQGGNNYRRGAKGWCRDNAKSAKPVGLQSGAWGIYDVYGNVWEWCQDWYGLYTQAPLVNPQGKLQGSYRILRGGGWNSSRNSLRHTNRYFFHPNAKFSYFGFRVVRTP